MPAFVSFSSKDEAIYSAICLALDGAEVKHWDQKTMSPGDSLGDQLREAIRVCEVCVFIATRRSIESQWCLAELGAFWGAGKKVLLFLADPDLDDSMLPPQFKGNLRVNTAQDLIKDIKATIEQYTEALAQAKGDPSYKFFETSGSYGTESDWKELFERTQSRFDLLGVTLGKWRSTPGFSNLALAKAKDNCRIRILLMHHENKLLTGLLYHDQKLDSVVSDIERNFQFYRDLAAKDETGNIEVRQICKGIPHFFLTLSDHYAVMIQYQSFQEWGSGPTWKIPGKSKLYNSVMKEFEFLWHNGTNGS